MKYRFYKYQGTGNDFVIFDGKKQQIDFQKDQINMMCDRRFGIGADGLIILENSLVADFKMSYFNSDGNQSSMCGNGGRCIVRFAQIQNYISSEASFEAIDGIHRGLIKDKNSNEIALLMNDVGTLEIESDYVFLDTGSPHYVTFVDDVDDLDVVIEGRKIRNSSRFIKSGTNVNFVKVNDGSLSVRTYERGVEDETLSCGTGVTAAVLAAAATNRIDKAKGCLVTTPGGQLNVTYSIAGNGFTNIYLIGPAMFVFEGEIDI